MELCSIIFLLDQLHLGDISFIVKFMKLFEEQNNVLGLEIKDTLSAFTLWLQDHVPGCKVPSHLLWIISCLKALFSKSVNLVDHPTW